MIEYVSDNIIASARRRARAPDNAFSADELLAFATEEMETYLAPLVLSVQEAYYQTHTDFSLLTDSGATTIPVVTYRIPPRAVGNALRDLQFIDTSGRPVDVPQIEVSDMEFADWGFILEGQSVTYLNRSGRSDCVTMRMTYMLAPNRLCRAAQAAKVSSIVGSAIGLTALDTPTWPLDAPTEGPAPLSFIGDTSFDFIRVTPGFEVIAFDQAGTCDGSTLTLSGSAPSGLAVGDYVSLAYYSPVPQIPRELTPLLSQAIACRLLAELGDAREEKELAKRKLLEDRLLSLIQNRVRGAPKPILARHNIFFATTRW